MMRSHLDQKKRRDSKRPLGIACVVVVVLATVPARAQSFAEALSQAYSYNPQLAASRVAVRAADEGVPQALSGWRPSVQIVGEIGRAVASDSSAMPNAHYRTPEATALLLTQPLYSGGRVASQLKQAKAQVEAQRAQLRSTESAVLLAAATAYLDVARGQRVVGLSRTDVALLESTLRAAQQQYAAGDITLADVEQARAREADGRAQLAMSVAQLDASRATYAQQVGVEPGILAMPRLVLPLPSTRAAAAAQALASNFAVRSARESYAASLAAIGTVAARLRPNIALTGELSRLKETDVQKVGQRSNFAELDVTLSVPLYQGGDLGAQIRRAKEQASRSRLQIDVALREARRAALTAWDMREATEEQLRAARISVAANEVAARGVVRQQSIGARTLLDVLNAQQELFSANVRLVTAQHDQLVAELQLLDAVGGLGAQELRLPVTIYDPVRHYDEVRGRWYGTSRSP